MTSLASSVQTEAYILWADMRMILRFSSKIFSTISLSYYNSYFLYESFF